MLYSNINNSKFNFEMHHPILDIDQQKYSHMFDLSIESDILNIPYKNNYLKFLGKKRDISYTFTEKQIYEGVIEIFSSEIENELNKKNRENTICEEEDEEIFFNENPNTNLIIGEDKKESDNTSEKNKIESHTNVESINISRELNRIELRVLKKNRKNKQRFNQTEIMTLNSEEEEEKEGEEEKRKEAKTKEQKEKNKNQKKVEFLVKTNKSRGKERKNKRNGNSNIKIHSKYDYDNVITSIQVHYINFIIKLANDILSSIYEQKKDLLFKDINYEFKKKLILIILKVLNPLV